VLPALLELGKPELLQRLGGKAQLLLIMEYANDWSLADVLLLAWTCMWFIVLCIKWTNPEISSIGGYFMIFFGISSGLMIYVFQLNAFMQAKEGAAEDDETLPERLLNVGSEAARTLERQTTPSQSDGRRRKMGPLPLGWRALVYLTLFAVYGGLAGTLLQVFKQSSKPAPNVSDMKSLNEAFKKSIHQGGAHEGLLHTVAKYMLGSHTKGSMGSCSKKGQKGGPPGDLPCQDLPSYQVPGETWEGLSFTAFNSTHGGPIYDTKVTLARLPPFLKKRFSVNLEVAFVTGLENLKIGHVRLVDRGIFNESIPSQGRMAKSRQTRKMQLSVSFIIDTPATSRSLPISVHVGKASTVPCCELQSLTAVLNFRCNREYPFFSFEAVEDSVDVKIEPPDALSLHLLPGFSTDFGISQAKIEKKLAQLLAGYANSTMNTTSVPELGVFYPYETFSLADGLSYVIRSNLPLSSSAYWDFCPAGQTGI